MTTEEKTYKDSLLRAKAILNGPFGDQCYDAIIQIFPELKEDKDEKMRKWLINYFEKINGEIVEEDRKKIIAYLDKQKEQKPIRDIISGDAIESCMLRYLQSAANRKDDIEIIEDTKAYKSELIDIIEKEQKPAEWSEEFLRLMGITISQDGNQVCVLLGENLAEGIAGFGDTLADAVEEFKKEWRQFDRFRKATWKPSEEQMEALNDAVGDYNAEETASCEKTADILTSLYNDLQKLL